jgi:hypothetical protein
MQMTQQSRGKTQPGRKAEISGGRLLSGIASSLTKFFGFVYVMTCVFKFISLDLCFSNCCIFGFSDQRDLILCVGALLADSHISAEFCVTAD